MEYIVKFDIVSFILYITNTYCSYNFFVLLVSLLNEQTNIRYVHIFIIAKTNSCKSKNKYFTKSLKLSQKIQFKCNVQIHKVNLVLIKFNVFIR